MRTSRPSALGGKRTNGPFSTSRSMNSSSLPSMSYISSMAPTAPAWVCSRSFQRCRIHHRKPGDVPALCQSLGIQTLFPGQQQEQGPGPVAVLEDEVLESRTPRLAHFFRLSVVSCAGELHPFIGDSQPFQQFIAFPFPVTGEGGGASGLPCRYSKSFAHTDLLFAGTGKNARPSL